MKFTTLIISLAIMSSVQAQQASQKMTLKECLNYANTNSPLKKRSEVFNKEIEAKRRLSRSEFLPQVNLYTDYRQFIDNTTYVFPEEEGSILSSGTADGPYPVRLGQQFNLFAGASISQVLFDKRWLLSNDMEALSSDLAALSEEALNEEIILGVSTLYYETQKLNSKQMLLSETMERLSKLQGLLKLQHENGVLKQSELDRLSLRISQMSISQDQLSQTRSLLVDRIKYLIGMPMETTLEIEDEEMVITTTQSQPGTSVQARLRSKQEELSVLSVKAIAGEYFPSVRAYGDFQFQAQRNSFNFFASEKWFPQHYFGVGINFPILTGQEKKAKIDLEQIRLEELRLDQEEKESEELFELRKSRDDLTIASRYLDQRRDNKTLSERLLKEVELEYEQGITPLRELLMASSDQIEAANLYEEAYFEYKLAQINYLKAISGLEELLL